MVKYYVGDYMKTKIGIPKALLYYRYETLWKTFFERLDCEIVESGDTTKEILTRGTSFAIDEACLSYKIYLGHLESLIGKCDYILIPRIATFAEREIVCTRFEALYDVVCNIFRDRDIKILDYNVDVYEGHTEKDAFINMGKILGKSKKETLDAYLYAKGAMDIEHKKKVKEQEKLLKSSKDIKILLVAHPYNTYDAYIGSPVVDYLKSLGCTIIYADLVDREKAREKGHKFSNTLQWTFNKELVGAIEMYKDKVDGIVLMSSFPCGPDSLVNEMLVRRIKKPMVTLILDVQDGTAGRETRLESFVDIIKLKKEEENEKAKN